MNTSVGTWTMASFVREASALYLMLLLMFSMAGVPPTVGFYAKLAVLQAALLPVVPARMSGVPMTVAYRPADGLAAGGDLRVVAEERPVAGVHREFLLIEALMQAVAVGDTVRVGDDERRTGISLGFAQRLNRLAVLGAKGDGD